VCTPLYIYCTKFSIVAKLRPAAAALTRAILDSMDRAESEIALRQRDGAWRAGRRKSDWVRRAPRARAAHAGVFSSRNRDLKQSTIWIHKLSYQYPIHKRYLWHLHLVSTMVK
jgi:hypothetical protein